MFVDDEPRVLEGLEMMLFDHVEDWEMSFHRTGEEALAHLEHHPVDVIVSDMRMQGMSGEELLLRVKERHPQIIRIVLSGQVEPEVAERVLFHVHDFLSKPTEPELLIATIRRALALAGSGRSESLRRLVGNFEGLPPRPSTYLELRSALQDPDCGLSDLARIIDRDMSMTATLLHLANSAYFARGHRSETLTDAVNRLGADTVAAVALSTEALASFTAPGIDVEAVNEHAIGVLQVIASALQRPRHAELEAAALHPIGSLVIAAAQPEKFLVATRRAKAEGISQAAAEEAVLGFNHAHAGAYLLRLWNLEPTVPDAIESMYAPWEAEGEARRAAAAIWACHADGGLDLPPPASLPQDIAEILEAVREHMERAA